MNGFSFKPVAAGVILSLFALLAGMMHGMAFGANEAGIKKIFKASAEAANPGNAELAKEYSSDAWKTLKRAHLHFMGLGAAALAMCLFAGLSNVSKSLKLAASTLVGFGALVYPIYYTVASFKVASAGEDVAHETFELIAQAGAGSSLIGLLAMIFIAFRWALSSGETAA